MYHFILRSKNRRQTTSDSPPLSELSTRSQSTTETGGQHHNQYVKSHNSGYSGPQSAVINMADGQVTALTQTPSSNHHHSHHKERHHHQKQHHLNVQQGSQNLQLSRRNSSAACSSGLASGVGPAGPVHQLHMDPLNAVALPDNGILSVNQQQMLQPHMLSQQQPNFTSSSLLSGGVYQQQSSSILQRNFLASNGGGGASGSRLSTVSKHSISQNMASNLQHPQSGKRYLYQI